VAAADYDDVEFFGIEHGRSAIRSATLKFTGPRDQLCDARGSAQRPR
jgi:hypothetical protein